MNSTSIKRGLVGAVAAMLVFAGASTSMAASKVTVDLPNEPVAGGESANVPVFLTGFTFEKLAVTLIVDEGTLTVTDSNSALTLNPGYTDLANQAEISFFGDTAAVVSAMESGVSWTAPGEADAQTELSIRVQVGEYLVGTSYDPATGHSYKYVTTPLTWSDAAGAAMAMTFKGKTGYLANITTAAENDFISNKSGAEDIWFGATAHPTNVNSALTLAGKPTISADTQGNGFYYWFAGPEGGTQFSTGLVNPLAFGGAYNSWATGEPNNAGPGESCGVTNWGGIKGNWNDLNCGREQSYLVEFDTTAADFQSSVTSFDNITGEDVDAFPAEEEVVEEEDKELAATGYDAGILFALALVLLAAGFTVVVRARKN